VEFESWKLAAKSWLSLAVEVFNEHGIEVFATIVPADLMNNGTYRLCLTVLLNGISGTTVAEWEDLIVFEINDAASELRGAYHGEWPGVVRPNLAWKSEMLAPLPSSFVTLEERNYEGSPSGACLDQDVRWPAASSAGNDPQTACSPGASAVGHLTCRPKSATQPKRRQNYASRRDCARMTKDQRSKRCGVQTACAQHRTRAPVANPFTVSGFQSCLDRRLQQLRCDIHLGPLDLFIKR
jgi:hypothetical protein